MLAIGLLGPLEVRAGADRVLLTGIRARSLLAVLALNAGRAVPAETLLDRCWGDGPGGDHRASLHSAVRRLRVVLGEDTLVRTDSGYLLDVPPDQVDAVAFTRLLDGQDPDGRDEGDEGDRLDAALALWRGEPFGGDVSDWLHTYARPRLVELRLAAIERRADLDLAAGRPDRALDVLHDPVAAYPLRESLWVRLLTALDAGGRRAEALDRYEEVRSGIAAELGVEPGPELRAVRDRLLRPDVPAADPPDPADPAALTPALDPDAADPAGPAPPGRPAPPVPQQLPTDVPRFLGRDELLERLDTVLGPPGSGPAPSAPSATLVLHGLGGSGKTSLAVHWAHAVGDRFPDGRLFADLRGYGPGAPVPPVAVLADLLRGLGVDGSGIPAGQDARSALLRSTLAGRRVLVVLDNARDEEQVRPLLPGAGGAVVVTSRSRLSGLSVRDGATAVAVPPLPGAEAVRFLAARLRRPVIGLAALAERCAGLPLALGIAAQRVLDHPDPADGLADVLAELADASARLDALESHDAATDLRAVLSWSYEALDAATARSFRLLGVSLTPVLTAPSAAALTGTDGRGAARTLRRLVELNLLTEERPGRFRLHDLLAAYAAERCDAEDGPAGRRAAEARQLDWYVHTVHASSRATGEQVAAHHPGPPAPGTTAVAFPDPAAAHGWLAAQGPALPGVVRAAARRGHDAGAARLAVLLWHDLYRRSATDDAEAVQRIAIEAARAAGLERTAALAVNQLGVTHGMRGELDPAEELLEESLALFARLGDPLGQAIAHSNLAMVHQVRDDRDRWRHHVECEADLARQAGDDYLVADAGVRLSRYHLTAGRPDDARRAVDVSILAVQALPPGRRGFPLEAFGEVLAAAGDLPGAIARFEEALRCYAEEDDPYSALDVRQRLGTALRDAGRTDEARATWEHLLDELDRLSGVRAATDREEVLALLASLPARPAVSPP